MNRVRLLLFIMVSPLFWSASLAQSPDKDDREVLTAYSELLELAKIGGYDGHKDAKGKLIVGLKSKQFVTSFDEKDPRLTQARLDNIKELSELIYKLEQQSALKGVLEYGRPHIVSREISGIKIEAGLGTPAGVMFPNTVKWTWWLKKGLDGWRIFATSIDIVPSTGSGFGRNPNLL